jgi:hypothetical protein
MDDEVFIPQKPAGKIADGVETAGGRDAVAGERRWRRCPWEAEGLRWGRGAVGGGDGLGAGEER